MYKYIYIYIYIYVKKKLFLLLTSTNCDQVMQSLIIRITHFSRPFPI